MLINFKKRDKVTALHHYSGGCREVSLGHSEVSSALSVSIIGIVMLQKDIIPLN